MDWIKVKVKHADYDFSEASGDVFKAWVRAMTFVAATERVPTELQIATRVGKNNYDDLVAYLKENDLPPLSVILDKVMEDVSHINTRREHDRKYITEYRCKPTCKPLRKPLQSADVNGKIREEKIREDIKAIAVAKPSLEDYLKGIKDDPTYKHVNIDNEVGKMKKWLSTHPRRKLTPRFILNWINKIEAPLDSSSTKRVYV